MNRSQATAAAQRQANATNKPLAIYARDRTFYVVGQASDVLPGSTRIGHVSPQRGAQS